MFEGAPDAIFVEAYDGTVLDANPEACALHGMPREELVGKNVLELVPPDQREAVAQAFHGWKERTLEACTGFSYTKDGLAIPVEIRGRLIVYGNTPAILLNVRKPLVSVPWSA